MHGLKFLHTRIEKACAHIHRARLAALFAGVRSLLEGAPLTLTGLGRGVGGAVYEKHNIKRIDRLLGNRHLHHERLSLYQALLAWLMRRSGWVTLLVLVDWSDCPNRKFLMLKAAVPVGGRALALYHEVHPLSDYKSARVHEQFLRRLAQLIPPSTRVLVIADAGFQRPWFEVVEQLGWHWIGRLAETTQVRVNEQPWQAVKALPAAGRAVDFGWCQVAKSEPYRARLCLIHRKCKQRKDRPSTRAHGHGSIAARCRKANSAPWALVTSLPPELYSAEQVVNFYAQRMQVEETFRDFKSPRFGYGLEYTRSNSPERLEILLLIATLAMLVQWLYGSAGEMAGWSRHFQANTVSHKRVLSLFTLGARLLRNQRFIIELRLLVRALANLWRIAAPTPALT
jgi:hypothetical protein